MPRTVEEYTIFLASPGDVAAERDQVRQVVDEMNQTVAQERGIRFKVVGWDTDAYPAYGGDGQSIINSEIGEMADYDVFVGILWNRFGTPTPRAASGTEEEFNRAVDAYERTGRPHIMLYFGQAPFNFGEPSQIEQKGKVLQFKLRLQGDGLPWEYPNPQEFRVLFQRHLTRWLTERTVTTPPAPAAVQAVPTQVLKSVAMPPHPVAKSVDSSGSWALLNNTFFRTESVQDRADGTVVLRIAPADGDEETALRSLRPKRQFSSSQVGYAYQNDAAIMEVKTVETESVEGRSVWSITLGPSQDSSGSSRMEMGMNNYSPDQIATMRARLLLLNEVPSADNFVMMAVYGRESGLDVRQGVFPHLWARFRDRPDDFLPLARLFAVFNLKVTRTVEHVMQLSLGPVDNGEMKVEFRGRRHDMSRSVGGFPIEVSGKCKLTP